MQRALLLCVLCSTEHRADPVLCHVIPFPAPSHDFISLVLLCHVESSALHVAHSVHFR